jgi:YHS domain-containing protein
LNSKNTQKLILFLIWPFFANGQLIIDLKTKNTALKNTDFEVIGVKSKLNYSTIGEVYISSNQKQKVRFRMAPEKAIESYFKQYNTGNKKVKVEVIISNLNISENMTSSNSISGRIVFDIEAYFVTEKDTTKFCNSRNSAKYTRTPQNSMLENVEKQVIQTLDSGLKYIIGYIKNSKANLEAFATDSEVIIKPFYVKPSIDTVYYQQRKVTWADFNGPVRRADKYGAAIFTSFGFDSKLSVENGVVRAEITPKVYTDKNMSWAKPEIKNQYALAHEQLHFDICYLNTLRFLAKIKTLKEPTRDDLISRIQYEYLEFYRNTHTMQTHYDDETNHSLIKHKQQEWEQKIKNELAAIDLRKIID